MCYFAVWLTLLSPSVFLQVKSHSHDAPMSSSYQALAYYEVFTPQGSKALPFKVSGSKGVRREYDKNLKGSILAIEGMFIIFRSSPSWHGQSPRAVAQTFLPSRETWETDSVRSSHRRTCNYITSCAQVLIVSRTTSLYLSCGAYCSIRGGARVRVAMFVRCCFHDTFHRNDNPNQSANSEGRQGQFAADAPLPRPSSFCYPRATSVFGNNVCLHPKCRATLLWLVLKDSEGSCLVIQVIHFENFLPSIFR